MNKKRKTGLQIVCVIVLLGLLIVASSAGNIGEAKAAVENVPSYSSGSFPLASGEKCFLSAHRASQKDFHGQYDGQGNEVYTSRFVNAAGYDFTNTPSSIELAMENGADMVEIDVRPLYSSTTGGGTFIAALFHDYVVDVDGDGVDDRPITRPDLINGTNKYDFETLASYYSQNGYTLLSLNAFLSYMSSNYSDKYVFIDLKNQFDTQLATNIVNGVVSAGFTGKCVVRIEPAQWKNTPEQYREGFYPQPVTSLLATSEVLLRRFKAPQNGTNVDVMTSINAWEVFNEHIDNNLQETDQIDPIDSQSDVTQLLSYLSGIGSGLKNNADVIIFDTTSFSNYGSSIASGVHALVNSNTNNNLAVFTGGGASVVETSMAGADIITAGDRICDKTNAFLLYKKNNITVYNHQSVVKWAKDNSVYNFTNSYFDPSKTCGRTDALLLLWNYAGRPSSSGSLPSGYVSYATNSDEYKAILWAYNHQYITGNTYSQTMTRAQFALILYRIAGTPSSNTNVEQYFSDCSNLSNGFKKAIVWVKVNNLMSGNSNGTFNPSGTINRVNVTNVIKKYDALP